MAVMVSALMAVTLVPGHESTVAAQTGRADFAPVTALLRQMVNDGAVAGAVAGVQRDGRTVYLEAVGQRDVGTGAPMSPDTLFRIYSMTKPVTAVLVMQLIVEGRATLDAPVSRFLPEFADVRVAPDGGTGRAPARPITARDLLLHTSGLSHRTSELYRTLGVRSRTDTLPTFIRKIAAAPLMEDPGTRFRYSEASTVLGRLVEIWTGVALDDAVQQRVLTPLKMADTSFWVRPSDRGRLATVYTARSGSGLEPIEPEPVPFTDRPALLEGAVGLVSTVPDYLRFAQMLLNGGQLDGVRLLPEAVVASMVRDGLSPEVRALRGGTMGWGLANVNVADTALGPGPGTASGEYGWDGTAGTIFWNDPSTRTVVVLMTQHQPANPGGIRERFKAAVGQALTVPGLWRN